MKPLRKALALAALLLGLAWPDAHAQIFRGALTLGLNSAQIDGDLNSGFNKVGALAGLALRTRFDSKAQLALGLHYIAKGNRIPSDPDLGTSELKTRLDYVELPLLLHYDMANRFNFHLGAGVALLLKATAKENGEVFPDRDLFYKTFDFTAIGGVGYEWTDRVESFIRWAYSVPAITTEVTSRRNHTLAFGLHYAF